MSSENPANATPKRRCRHRAGLFLAGLAVLGLAGAGVAWAATQGFAHRRPFRHMGAGMMKLHAEFVVDRALKQVDASDDQRQQVEAVVQRLFEQHKALCDQHQQVRDEVHAILTADTVDRARLEALRAQQVARIEKGSRELTQAIGDVAEVLTPEQRRELVGWAHELHQ